MLSLIPISDANPTRRFPIVTLALIALNVVAFFLTPGLGGTEESSVYFFEKAPLACQLDDTCQDLDSVIGLEVPDRNFMSFLGSVLYSTFLHGGFFHIIGNMLFLWVFGNNVEDFLGPVKFALFYLLGGIIASFAHVWWTLSSSGQCEVTSNGLTDSCIPSVGASGAVAAVMGAYLLLFPRARVNVLVPIFIVFTVIQMSALATLLIWFAYQGLIAWQDLNGVSSVAWMAHVGGFVFGVVAIFLLGGRPHRPQPVWQPQVRY